MKLLLSIAVTLFVWTISLPINVSAGEGGNVQFTKLLGKKLKDDQIIEILENNEAEVIYDFDRTHENGEDAYWVKFLKQGFEFSFNKKQILVTIFLYIEEKDGYKSIDKNLIDIPIYNSFDEAESTFKKHNMPYVSSPEKPGTKWHKWWIKTKYKDYTIHYQFMNNRIRVISISIKDDV